MKDVVDGVVLAGGRSRRMDGVDKALMHYRGKKLFEYAAENLLPHVRRVLINRSAQDQLPPGVTSSPGSSASQAALSQASTIQSSCGLADASQFTCSAHYQIIQDQRFVGDGPLSGILNTFEQTDADYLMIASCDQLPLPPEVYATLLNLASAHSGAYAFDGKHIVPTCAVLPRSALSALDASLQQGDRRLISFMQQHAEQVDFANTRFANINSPDQLDV